jgi:fused signal recognition particle receptor
MALGFIKKIFSFGKKEIEDLPGDAAASLPAPEANAEAPAAPIADAAPMPGREPAVEGPLTDFLRQPPVEPAATIVVEDQAEPQPVERPVVPTPGEIAWAAEPPLAEMPAEQPAPEVPTEPEQLSVSVPLPPAPSAERLAEVSTPPLVAPPPPAEPAEAPLDLPQPAPTEVFPDAPVEMPAEPVVPYEAPAQAGAASAISAAVPIGPAKVTVSRAVERKADAAPAEAAPAPRLPWFQRLREGLSRSSRELSSSISGIFTKRKLDDESLQDLEDVLIRADLGVETALRITDTLSASRYGKDISDVEVRTVMAQEVEKVLAPVALPLELDLSHKPHVILVVGVNGTGKTTTIGKLAAKLTAGGLSVTLAAGDTFRAAAIEQLKIWGERTGSPVVSSKIGADAAGLAWDAYEQAKEAGSDVLIIDTAGRLQNKTELMAELEKIVRVLGNHDPDAPHTVLQTVDATTGQNALNQVEIFRNVAGVNGLVMTKLDGTARGGILVAIAAKHRLPVYFIGVGEQVDDLEPFSAGDFAKAIAGVN